VKCRSSPVSPAKRMRRHRTASAAARFFLLLTSAPGVVACLVLAACVSEARMPSGCIAPANPGGGWDFSCRAVSQVLGARAPGGQPLHVTHMPGEGGAVAFKSILRPGHAHDPVIIAASPSTLLGLAQHHYGDHTERDVRWIAAVDAERGDVVVDGWRTKTGANVQDRIAQLARILTRSSSEVRARSAARIT